ncbi:MAG: CRISPR-associated endonuclease Cas1 [Acidilobaceae archaeon]
MRVLHVAGYGVKIGVNGSSLVIESKSGKRKIPVWEVDVVVVASSGVSVTSRALRLMVRSGVELLVLDSRGDPVGILYSSYYTRTPETRRAQYLAVASGRAAYYVVSIARCKIGSQASVLERLSVDFSEKLLRASAEELRGKAESLEELLSKGDLDEVRGKVMNVEAQASKIYWSSIALVLPRELEFNGRDRESADQLNLSLNYAYAILYGLAWRALVLAGLDPYAGFLHVDRSGKPVLAFDYVEMWRAPVVDEVLVRAFRKGLRIKVDGGRIDSDDRARIASLISKRLKERCPNAYRTMTFEEALKGYALKLASSLRRGSSYTCYGG